MKPSICQVIALAVAGIFYLQPTVSAQSQYLDQIGMTLLRATTTNLNGTDIRVAHPEDRPDSPDEQAWEVNPAHVGQPVSRFTYASADGTTNAFPNALGTNTFPSHADDVASKFYGIPNGVATNVAHVDNFEETYFFNHYIAGSVALNDPLVSQSYTFGPVSVPVQQQLDSQFDDYAMRFKTLFVSAADNYDNVHAPATCYNGIGVGAYGGVSSIGPTADNGRCKPDICAPDYATSFATPQVAGSAAVLLQAALRGDGGSKVKKLAADPLTLKALLLNGATKPDGWTNSSSTPLDARYGAGIVNIYNSYQQLIGGKQGRNASSRLASGSPHLPAIKNKTVSVLNGWDFSTIASSAAGLGRDGVNHYYFNVTNDSDSYICQATLVWNRQLNKTSINNLDLFLYDCANGSLVACSTSRVDNVEHIFAPNLPAGRYDLQVWKAGGSGIVSPAEFYALAFAFIPSPVLTVTTSKEDRVLSWLAYPAGLVIQATTDPAEEASWSTGDLPEPVCINGRNVIWLNPTETAWYFRLRQR